MNEELTFEQSMKRLEEIVGALEDADLSLAAGMALYREGALRARDCRQMLANAKHELEAWNEEERSGEERR